MATRNSAWSVAAAMLLIPAARGQEQPAAPQRAKFEVASLKPNQGCEDIRGVRNLSPSPGRLEMPCVTLASLIQAAYGTFGDGVTIDTQPLRMEGGPS